MNSLKLVSMGILCLGSICLGANEISLAFKQTLKRAKTPTETNFNFLILIFPFY